MAIKTVRTSGAQWIQSDDGDPLPGQFFHDNVDGLMRWQGYVVGRVPGYGSYLVQLISWFSGDPTRRVIVPFDELKRWDFYPTAESMRSAYADHTNGKPSGDTLTPA